MLSNAQGQFVLTVPAARVTGQSVTLTARAIGFKSVARIIQNLTAGEREVEFALNPDVNRLEEIIVTGVVEGVERVKVPFSVGRVTAEDLPVPALNPITALQGKVAGVRIAATTGTPGSTPEIMLRGPTSINASGRGQGPLIIVDDAIMNVGSLTELGALDIESIEVVKGAAGASLYGTRAANGVISIKTKRGLTGEDGVRFNVRTEYGVNDFGTGYGIPVNHHLQLDETGQRFCITPSGGKPCDRTADWMTEILRINNVAADTTRIPQSMAFNSGGNAGDLRNRFQSSIWPGRYYNVVGQLLSRQPTVLTAVDATGKVGSVSFYVSGSYQDEPGAIRYLNGIQQYRGRVNLDYHARSDLKIALSTLVDDATTDLHSPNFGAITRGMPAGTNQLVRDTLGRFIVRGGGAGLRGTGNGGGSLFYGNTNASSIRNSNRFLGSMTASYFPAAWVTFEGTFAYDTRSRRDHDWVPKGFRTQSISTSLNSGQVSLSNLRSESMNSSLTATFRPKLAGDLNTKLSLRALYDEFDSHSDAAEGDVLRIADIYQVSNTTTNFDVGSASENTKNIGLFAGATLDYKDRYILEGSFRYDGSSRFGAGNRWAPFGRVSAVWRMSEEPWFNVGFLNELRFRASRGTAGSTPRFSAQYEVYQVGTGGISLDQAGNRNLRPETTTEYEVGTDFELFNRVGVEVTYAHGTTRDQILPVPSPAALGFTTRWENVGTLTNRTWEVAVNVPIVNSRSLYWQVRGTWDRNRTYISELSVPAFVTGDLNFFMTDSKEKESGFPMNRFGNIWGVKFLKTCGDLPAAFRSDCGSPTSSYQVNDEGWLVWVGPGNSWTEGVTRNLWGTILPAANAPFGRFLSFGHPIVDADPVTGQSVRRILGNSLPDFRFTLANDIQYKRLTLYTLLDATIGHDIWNQPEGWGLLDFNSATFDQAGKSVETAKPVGYSWRCGAPCNNAGTGGFYDALGPNNYVVEDGTYAKLREVSLTYKLGSVAGVGDWTVGLVGRNLLTLSSFTGFDPEIGGDGGSVGSSLINQTDDFGYPALRTFTFSLSTRF